MSRLGIVVNGVKGSISQYSGLNFNSLCFHNGKLIGASSNGIFILEGDSDNGTDIEAIVKTLSTDLESSNQKRLRSIAVSGDLKGDLKVFPVFDDDEAEEHTIDPVDPVYQRTYKVPVNRDNKGVCLGVRIENVNGAYFEIETIDILPIILNTR